jgi:hypothetical protein
MQLGQTWPAESNRGLSLAPGQKNIHHNNSQDTKEPVIQHFLLSIPLAYGRQNYYAKIS